MKEIAYIIVRYCLEKGSVYVAEIVEYKCPNCYANLKFNPQNQAFTCDFCASVFTQEEMQKIAAEQAQQENERPKEEIEKDEAFENGANVYICESCGAEVMADDNTAATFCYYCHNPVILKGRVDGKFRPNSVLPFQVTRERALNVFKEWCGKHWFLPSDFTYSAQQQKIVGLYVPFWVADCTLDADMHAIGKKVRTWTHGDHEYTETSEFSVTRRASVKMRGIPADGAANIDDDLMEACEPFDYRLAQPFSMQYLSGFMADKYDVDRAGVFKRVKQRAVDGTDQLMRNTMVGYSSVAVTRSDIHVQQTDWKYMLLPVWFLTYKYNDKVYEFAINGQSEKFAGEAPLCKWKQLLFSLAVALVTAGVTIGLGVLLTWLSRN